VLVLGFENVAEDAPEALEGKIGRNDVPAARTSSYTDESFLNDLEAGCSLVSFPDPASIRSAFPTDVPTGSFEKDCPCTLRRVGYLNRDGGWADASQGISLLLSEVGRLGAKILTGKAVSKILQVSGRATGVSCVDGTTYDADLIVIAAGSWTPSAFPDLGIQEACLATGSVSLDFYFLGVLEA
jgi:sarcosine oxidase/L-pipecolate oxidase